MSEFDLIKRYFYALGPNDQSVLVGPGDDCAVVLPPPNSMLCCSIDTLVEGVHVPHGVDGAHVATRALGSALSDLAAMGAAPSHFTLALTLPSIDGDWLNRFSSALAKMDRAYGVSLVGGDTTRGPLTVSIQVHGWLPLDKGLMRSGAEVGDLLVVSGTLGDAGAGLEIVLSEHSEIAESVDMDLLRDRFFCPRPRLDLGLSLRDSASSCIDISDGLVSDARHLANSSNVCLSLNACLLPMSDALVRVFPSQALEFALGAGDDYELLFTINPVRFELLAETVDTPLTVIGSVTREQVGDASKDDAGVVEVEGIDMTLVKTGYVHFE